MARRASSPNSATSYVDRCQSEGRYSFTRADAVRGTGQDGVALDAALRRLRAAERIVSPRRGFHVIVPVEYRQAGSPPPPWFIDDLMRFLGQPYYVGLLSAAALHGAAHHAPMVFQVITDRPTRPALAGRATVRFHAVRDAAKVPVVSMQTDTGSMRVSTPSATALDLARFADAAGGLSNVATIVNELSERIDARELTKVARRRAVPEVQRLGYILEHVGKLDLANALFAAIERARVRPTLLAPGLKRTRARPDSRWNVIANTKLEVDT